MSDFDIYEKHFTVMNYGENLVLKHIKCADFLGENKCGAFKKCHNTFKKVFSLSFKTFFKSMIIIFNPQIYGRSNMKAIHGPM